MQIKPLKINKALSSMVELLKFKQLVKLKKAKGPNPMTNVDTAASLDTGRPWNQKQEEIMFKIFEIKKKKRLF